MRRLPKTSVLVRVGAGVGSQRDPQRPLRASSKLAKLPKPVAISDRLLSHARGRLVFGFAGAQGYEPACRCRRSLPATGTVARELLLGSLGTCGGVYLNRRHRTRDRKPRTAGRIRTGCGPCPEGGWDEPRSARSDFCSPARSSCPFSWGSGYLIRAVSPNALWREQHRRTVGSVLILPRAAPVELFGQQGRLDRMPAGAQPIHGRPDEIPQTIDLFP